MSSIEQQPPQTSIAYNNNNSVIKRKRLPINLFEYDFILVLLSILVSFRFIVIYYLVDCHTLTQAVLLNISTSLSSFHLLVHCRNKRLFSLVYL